jgi:hypothetical protein
MRNLTGYLWRMMLVCSIMLNGLSAFEQYPLEIYQGAKPKGKIDTIFENKYEIPDNDTTIRSHDDKFVYIFNAKGHLVKSTEHSMDSYFTMITFYSYDEDGYIKEKRVDEKDKKVDTLSPFSKMTYNYGPLHQSFKADRSQTSTIKPDFLTDFTDAVDLDQSGKVLKDSSFYFGTSQITRRHNYHYNAKGYLVELDEAEGNIDGIPTKTFFTYDDNDNIIKAELTFYHGTYNHITTRLNTYIRTYSYPKLDNKHNWLIKNEYAEGKLERITERRIAYRK